MPFHIKDYLPDFKRWPADNLLTAVVSMIVSAIGTRWAATAESAPNITSVGWLVVFVALAFAILLLLVIGGWGAGWVRRQWHGGSAVSAAAKANDTSLIDPFLAQGERTYVSVFIDPNNWRARIIQKSNVFELNASFIESDRTAVRIVIIFDRWTFERGAVINTDNKLETYRTTEDAMTERYAIYSIHGIKPPCVIDIEFQSSPVHTHVPAERLPPRDHFESQRMAEHLVNVRAELANELAEIGQTVTRPDATGNLKGSLTSNRAEELINQLSYDEALASMCREYLHHCRLLTIKRAKHEDEREDRQAISEIGKKVFKMLHRT